MEGGDNEKPFNVSDDPKNGTFKVLLVPDDMGVP